MTLNEWITCFGIQKLSKHFGVNTSTIYRWKQGVNLPAPDRLFEIILIAKGALELNEVIRQYKRKGK